MRNEQKKINNLSKIIFVVILVFLIFPITGKTATNLDSGVNENPDSEETTSSKLTNEKIERYRSSVDQINKVVNNTVLILPKLEMIGENIMSKILTEVRRYNNFINDYTEDIETDGADLFDELLDGYRATRKMLYLLKDINDFSRSIQTSYEVINTSEDFLQENKKNISNPDDFQESISIYQEDLDQESLLLEGLTNTLIDSLKDNSELYEENIIIINTLNEILKDNIDPYLELSTDIIIISSNIINLNFQEELIEECMNADGEWDEKTSTCICKEGVWDFTSKKCIPLEELIEECMSSGGKWDEKTLTCSL